MFPRSTSNEKQNQIMICSIIYFGEVVHMNCHWIKRNASVWRAHTHNKDWLGADGSLLKYTRNTHSTNQKKKQNTEQSTFAPRTRSISDIQDKPMRLLSARSIDYALASLDNFMRMDHDLAIKNTYNNA